MNFKRLIPIYLGAIIGPMGGVGIITLLPILARDWNVNIQWVSLNITFYMVPYVIFQLFSGSIAQVFNARRTLLFGFGVYALGGVLSALAPSLAALVAFRFIQGLGAAFITPITLALVGEMVEPRYLGRSMGILGLTYTLGVTSGPLISGVLEVYLGWRWFFFFLAALAASVGALYFYTSAQEGARPKGSGGILAALAFVRQSYSYREVRFLGLAAFCLFLGYIGLMTFVADHLKTSFTLPSDKIGLILSMTGFLGIAAAPIAGFLGDRFGRKRVTYAGGAIMIASILGQAVLEYQYARYLLLFAVYGAGSATAWTSLNTLAVEVVPELRKPVVSLYNSFKFSGYAIAPLLLSLLYVPFSIPAVRWACISFILISLFFVSRLNVFTTEAQRTRSIDCLKDKSKGIHHRGTLLDKFKQGRRRSQRGKAATKSSRP